MGGIGRGYAHIKRTSGTQDKQAGWSVHCEEVRVDTVSIMCVELEWANKRGVISDHKFVTLKSRTNGLMTDDWIITHKHAHRNSMHTGIVCTQE